MDDECNSEVWSWWFFTPAQLDPYWIRCTLAVPHETHEDENTGLRWTDEAVLLKTGGEEPEKGRVSNS